MTRSTKKRYAKPRITAQGSIDKITLDDKVLGPPSDGFLFDGAPSPENAS